MRRSNTIDELLARRRHFSVAVPNMVTNVPAFHEVDRAKWADGVAVVVAVGPNDCDSLAAGLNSVADGLSDAGVAKTALMVVFNGGAPSLDQRVLEQCNRFSKWSITPSRGFGGIVSDVDDALCAVDCGRTILFDVTEGPRIGRAHVAAALASTVLDMRAFHIAGMLVETKKLLEVGALDRRFQTVRLAALDAGEKIQHAGLAYCDLILGTIPLDATVHGQDAGLLETLRASRKKDPYVRVAWDKHAIGDAIVSAAALKNSNVKTVVSKNAFAFEREGIAPSGLGDDCGLSLYDVGASQNLDTLADAFLVANGFEAVGAPMSSRIRPPTDEHVREACSFVPSGRMLSDVAVVATETARNKRWPQERWLELVAWLRARGMLVCHVRREGERAIPTTDFEVVSKPYEHIAALVSQCGLVVSVDTMLHHLGAALGVPTVCVTPANNSHAMHAGVVYCVGAEFKSPNNRWLDDASQPERSYSLRSITTEHVVDCCCEARPTLGRRPL